MSHKASEELILTTEQILKLMDSGLQVEILGMAPGAVREQLDGASGLGERDFEMLTLSEGAHVIESIEAVGVEEVQCISVDDLEHLYITDDMLPTHNTANVIFLKSNDGDMLETLQRLSGETHRVSTNSKTITKDLEKLMLRTEGKVSYTQTSEKVPVISVNNLLSLTRCNWIVFRSGDSPIWNRNETIMPMSWRLMRDSIILPGHKFTFQTVPTLSTAKDFDVRKNQPDFEQILQEQMERALAVEKASQIYRQVYDYSDFDIQQLDPDEYSTELMGLVDDFAAKGLSKSEKLARDKLDRAIAESATDNQEVIEQHKQNTLNMEKMSQKKYAEGQIASINLVDQVGRVNRSLSDDLIAAFKSAYNYMINDTDNFRFQGGVLYNAANDRALIRVRTLDADADSAAQAVSDPQARAYGSEDAVADSAQTVVLEDEFFRFLAHRPQWDFAEGQFEKQMAAIMRR